MSTIPHPTVPSSRGTGVWDDVSRVVEALGSTLDVSQLLAAIRSLLADRTGAPVEVFLIDREERLLMDLLNAREAALPARLAATLQISAGPVPVSEDLDPTGTGRTALGLRDVDRVVGLALFDSAEIHCDDALLAIAAMCGASLSRAVRFDQLARLTGASEQTRNMQQQILDHVSHEFNTPLMILRSSADFAREASDEERELFFDMHGQALDRLEQLVHGVIEVAHASAHGETQQIGIEEIVSSMVLPHFIDSEWPTAVPALWHRSADVRVEVEPDSLGLAIEHVIDNARVHAGPSGARVAVAIFGTCAADPPRRLEEALAALGRGEESLPTPSGTCDLLVVEVIDDGPGIPAAELSLVFEPFTQGSNSPLRGVSGAGMGLATASRLVEAAGGRIEVESTLGAGSLFRLRFPAH